MTTYTGTPTTLVAGDTTALVTKFNDHRDALKALSEAWTAYTTTWSAPTPPAIGNGTLVAAYTQTNKLVQFRINLTFGSSTSAGAGNWSFSLPVVPHAAITANMGIGNGLLYDASAPTYLPCGGGYLGGSLIYLAGGLGGVAAPTNPWTWAVGDKVSVSGTYEAA